MPILALRRTLRHISFAHALFLGQEYGRSSSPPRTDEHPRSAPVVELADVAKLFGDREAAEDP
jgi:hypothetical protein